MCKRNLINRIKSKKHLGKLNEFADKNMHNF